MNVRDSERIAGFLARAGYLPAEQEELADVLLVNTCSVRQKPEQKALSAVGRFLSIKRGRPDVVVGIAGCVAQQEGQGLLERFEGLDLVLGTRSLHRLTELIEKAREGQRTCATEMDGVSNEEMFLWPEVAERQSCQSFVSIMQGCNNYCAYCIVPYVRGPEVSRDAQDILDEVSALSNAGVCEVNLLGQNVNSYACDGLSFPELLMRVADVPGICRVRFTTSHPKDLSDELIRAMAAHPHIMEAIHLPVQAGSDKVLKAMNRGYTSGHYLGLVERLRQAMPEIGITTDLIVGFPGESEEDFQQTMQLIDKVRYDETFSFRYTPRPGTAAVELDDDVAEPDKYDRLYRLQERQREITEAKNQEQVGLVHEVLVQGISKRDPDRWTGRSRTNRLVHFPGSGICAGDLVDVKITRALKHSLKGRRQ